ncbi:hypothetical protein IT882_15160 [Microbacterium schleiferi]|uniref:Uncharacterized protein n=1 Tax=Microbacterium schleiferi TaxID=69362 RepID=A0A7S8MXE2_9MICO|nr:hypothetical protein [Microbacterium schleiferi]QPE04453.1 hypothetical protein IT882_15160 [Microbacterium schleiferi]
MVHSAPRPSDVDLARARAKAAFLPYRSALTALPEPVRSTITAYTGALSAEAAAQRHRAQRAEARLEALRAERGPR